MIRAVLFDIGSTLWSSPPEDPNGLVTVYSHARDVLARAGVLPLPAVETLIGAVEGYLAEWEDTWARDPGQTLQGPTTSFVADALARIGIKLDSDPLEELTNAVMEASVYTARALPREEGMAEALDDLHALGVRLACVSNAFMRGETLMRILDERGLSRHLEFVISSAETGIRKPDGTIYLEAVNRLNLEPHEAAYVGDRVAADVEGPAAVGMPGILTQQYRREDPAAARVKPAAIISHLRELPETIRLLNRR